MTTTTTAADLPQPQQLAPVPADPPRPVSAANLAYEAATKALDQLNRAASAADTGDTLRANNHLTVAAGYRELADTLAERGNAIQAPRPDGPEPWQGRVIGGTAARR